MSEKRRIILHVAMDHFFTAVEEREHPEYKGKPVIVGADPRAGEGKGVVSACNYEARNFGVRSGMPISKAWKLCPEAVYLPVDYELYTKVSDEVMDTLRKYADKFEQLSIGEAFLDATSRVKNHADAEALARQIKREILERERLTCSVGIGPNKLVAKIASDFKKPDGLTTVKEEEATGFLASQPVRRLISIGHKTEEKLRVVGIRTIGHLADYNPNLLTQLFGSMGTILYLMALGIDSSEVGEQGRTQSISREITFKEGASDFEFIQKASDRLSQEVHREVLKQNLFFKTVTLKLRYENLETRTHSKTLFYVTNRLQDLRKMARELMRIYLVFDRKVSLLSVGVSNLISAEKPKIK
jgi:DNA polymerase IV (DinB-like DNA polymerase)